MTKPTTLAEFYQSKIHWMPENLKQDIGHFNVFRLDDFVGPKACHLPYSRKDFYKITLVKGRSNYHFADKTVEIRGNALLFANPMVPYDWEPLDDNQTGYFCIFTEAFLQRYPVAGALDLPMFKPGGQPLYSLTDEQLLNVTQLFEKMATELDSDYAFKYDLLRNYVFELVHSALKLHPATTLYQDCLPVHGAVGASVSARDARAASKTTHRPRLRRSAGCARQSPEPLAKGSNWQNHYPTHCRTLATGSARAAQAHCLERVGNQLLSGLRRAGSFQQLL
jgi:hypothetical protein